jgi:hypothetical protein
MEQIRLRGDKNFSFDGERPVHGRQSRLEPSDMRSGKNWNAIGFVLLALLFGAILSYGGLQERAQRDVVTVPPHDISLSALIQDGPGLNRHVSISGFSVGGYAVESSSSRAWVALFPTGLQSNEIKAVLCLRAFRGETDVQRLVQQGRATGICSTNERSSWGMVLGPELEKANQGMRLSSAWDIEELTEPPSAARVRGFFVGAIVCLAIALILAATIFWKAKRDA